MPDDPPSILPRGTGTRRPLRPSPAFPGSAVYIQSVAGFSCSAGGAIGSEEISGGRSPASISATRQDESSERRDAMTAPADPPPTTTKSNSSDMSPPTASAAGAGIVLQAGLLSMQLARFAGSRQPIRTFAGDCGRAACFLHSGARFDQPTRSYRFACNPDL